MAFIGSEVYSQNGIYFEWYSQVGCYEYETGDRKLPIEDIEGDSNGIYNWSNGAVNSSIEVNRGGPYRLTYIPPNGGCKTVVDIVVPKSPDEFIWIFPEGCFEYCRNDNPYLIGPIPEMDSFEWLDDGNVEVTGNDMVVPDFDIFNGDILRNLQLSLSDNGCTITSGDLNATLNTDCNSDCKPTNFKVEGIETIDEPFLKYELYSNLVNPYNQTTTFIFTEANGAGVFNPSSVTLSPGQSYSFNPLTFIPNSNFGGNFIDLVIKHKQQGNILCREEYRVDLRRLNQSKMRNWIKSVSPNPFSQKLRVDYQIPKDVNCNNLELNVYDMQGKDYIDQRIDKAETYQDLQTDSLPLGQYILILRVDGQIKDQKIIIKK